MAEAHGWRTADSEMALALASELLVPGWGPVDVLLDDILGAFVVVAGDDAGSPEAEAFLSDEEPYATGDRGSRGRVRTMTAG